MQITSRERTATSEFYYNNSLLPFGIQCQFAILKKIRQKKNKWSPHLHVLQKPKHCMLKRVREWKINEKDEFQWCEPRAPLVTPFIENCHSFYLPSPFHLDGIVIRIENLLKITIGKMEETFLGKNISWTKIKSLEYFHLIWN